MPLDWSSYGNKPRIIKDISAQLGIGRSAKRIVSASTSAKGALNGVVVFNLLMSFMQTLSLNLLWGMINALQMIVFLPLYNITFPASVNQLFSVLIQIATFDIIPYIDDIYDFLFKFKFAGAEVE